MMLRRRQGRNDIDSEMLHSSIKWTPRCPASPGTRGLLSAPRRKVLPIDKHSLSFGLKIEDEVNCKEDWHPIQLWLSLPMSLFQTDLQEKRLKMQEPAAAQMSPATFPTHPAPKRPRKGREKTELCRYYLQGVVCPFKEMCSYAHGEHELRDAVLSDLVEDLSGAKLFRSRPCFDWVATGSW